MSNNIIEFPEPEQLVFICGCECSTFIIYQNGKIECANCNEIKNGHTENTGEWVKKLPLSPDVNEVKKDDAGTIKHSTIGSKEFAIKSVLKEINKWINEDEIVFLTAYNLNGVGKHWFGGETTEQYDWLTKKMSELIKYMDKGKPNE